MKMKNRVHRLATGYWLAGLLSTFLTANSVFAATTAVRVINATFGANQTGTVTVQAETTGEEAAFGFTLNFDPTRLTFGSIALGPGATGATLNVNSLQAAQGRIGIVLGVGAGLAFPAGLLDLLQVSFTTGVQSGLTLVNFGDVPVVREVSNRQARPITATFSPGAVRINSAPNANNQSVTVLEDGSVSISLSATDSDGDSLTYTIGSQPTRGTLSGSAPNLTYRPNPNVNGPDSFSFTVSDGIVSSGSATVSITVTSVNDPPTLNPISSQLVTEGNPLTLTASATDGDVPPDSLTFSLEGAPAGASINSSTGAFTWTPTEAQGPESHTILVRVTDSGSPPLSATQSFTVTVNEGNQPPVFPTIPSQTVNEGNPVTVVAAALDPDQPPQALTYSFSSGAPPGASIDSSSGIITWTPTEAQGPGSYTITVRVADSAGASATQTVGITVLEVNAPPTLAPISNQTVKGGATLTVTARGTDTDLPAQSLAYSLPFGGPVGASMDPTTGVFTWSPPAGQPAGTEFITVQVADSGGLNASQSFTIDVSPSNTAPTVGAIGPQTINEGSPLTLTISATDSDQPAQTLTYSLEGGAPPGASINPTTGAFGWTPTEAQGPSSASITVRVTDNGVPPLSSTQSFTITVNEVNTPPTLAAIAAQTIRAGSPLTVTAQAADLDLPPNPLSFSLGAGAPQGAAIDPSTGVFTWTPTPAQGGATVPITIQVSDNAAPPQIASRTFNVVVSPSNTPPTLASIADQSIPEGAPFSLTITGSDTDVPANAFSYSLGSGAPTGLSLNPTTGVLTWTPTEAQGPSTSQITVVVQDDGVPPLGATNRFQIAVTEVNQPPSMAPIANQTVEAGQPLAVSVTAADPDLPANILTFSLGGGAPTGVNINPGTGAISWTPTGQQGPSTNRLTVVVTDNGSPSLSTNQTFTVVVTRQNQLPVLTLIPGQTIEEGRQLTFTATAADPDQPVQTIAYSLGPGAPAGAAINSTSGVFTWTPTEANGPGTNVVAIRATDNGSPPLRASQDVRIVVTEANLPPVLAALTDQTISSGDTLKLTARATDPDLPPNLLAYSLDPGAPAGASIVAATGEFTWTATAAQAPSTNRITVRASDNGTPILSDTKSFVIVVRAGVNLPPTISQISNQTTAENRPTGAIAFTIGDPDTPISNLKVLATSSNPLLIPVENIAFSGDSTNRTVTITPALNQTGTASISVSVEENTGARAATTFEVTVSALPPTIVRQPDNVEVPASAPATFSVTASGSQPLSFQWRFNGTDIAGATNTVLALSNVQTNNAGAYSVVVRNRLTSVTSRDATLAVNEPLRITKQPVSQSALSGASVTFSVTAGGRAPLRYQWKFNGVDMPGATGPSLVFNAVLAANAGNYSVTVSNDSGSVPSEAAKLEVNAPVAFTQQPASQTVVAGTNVTFSVQATGTPAPRFQWQFNGVDIGGQTGPTLQLANVSNTSAGDYSVVASNPAGSTNSAKATLVVSTPPVFSRQPQSQIAKAGDSASFNVTVSGTEPLQYRWRFRASPAAAGLGSRAGNVALSAAKQALDLPGSEVAGASGPSLTVSNVQAANEGEYFAVVTNPAGTVVSASARLSVTAPVRITQQPQNQTVPEKGTATFFAAATGTPPLLFQWRVNSVDIPGATNSTLTVANASAQSAGSYQVVVSNASGPQESSAATLTVQLGVTILTQPQSVTVTNGATAVFSVVAAGAPPISYQWRFEGQNIPGQTGPSLSVSNVQIVNSGNYSVAVKNPAGEVISGNAALGVIAPAQIQTPPASQIANLGASVSFSVTASGDAPLGFQWQKNGVNIEGATGLSHTIASVSATDQGDYTVVVQNPGGAVTSAPANLKVNLPENLGGSSSQQAKEFTGEDGQFSGGSNEAGPGVLARKNAPARAAEERWFSWRAPSSGIVTFSTGGSTFDTELAVFTGVAPNLTEVGSDDDRGGFLSSEVRVNVVQGTAYVIRVKGFGGATGSIVVGFKLQRTAQRLPEIKTAPQSQTVRLGARVTLVVDATGSGLSYQWFGNGTAVPGATRASFEIPSVQEADARKYTVKVTADSSTANPVTIETLPAIIQISDTPTTAEDKFKKAPRLEGQQLQSLHDDRSKQAGGSVARGYSGSQVFNTFGAAKEQGEPNHCDEVGGASQWFVYAAPKDGIVRVSTEGSTFDTVLAVYTGPGTDFASLKLEACDNNSGADGKTSALSLRVKQGTSYYVAVDGVKGATGTVKLGYQFGEGPSISTQPVSQSVALGATAALFVEVTNALSSVTSVLPAVGFQWQKDGLPVRGETNRSLALLNLKTADAGDYLVVAYNFAGATTSAVARVSVNVPLSFTLVPQSQTVKPGNTATFIVTASGTQPITYQWRLNGVNISGATNTTLELPNVQALDAGGYTVVAKNPASTIESPAALLSINQAPGVTVPPVDQVAVLGGTATFNVAAIGTPPLSYEWRLNGVTIPGAVNATLTINNVSPASVGEYTAVVSNSADSVVSPPAKLSIRIPLTLLEEPQSQTVSAGSSAIFNVRPAGAGPFAYQWKKDGVAIAGANGATYTRPNVQEADAGQYTVAVASGAELAESKPAILTVGAAPAITQQPASLVVFAGTNVTFTVTASGANPLSYQWYRESLALPGATNSVLELNNVQPSQAGTYSASVSNPNGSVVSALAVLTVQQILSDARFDAVAGFQFRLNLPEGKRATVQISTDLINWTNYTPTPVTGVVDIQDPQATIGVLNFYRILVE